MTRDDIIRMAREAGFRQYHNSPIEWHMVTEDIERFAALVAAEATRVEREECARVCEETVYPVPRGSMGQQLRGHDYLAAAIRARGEKP